MIATHLKEVKVLLGLKDTLQDELLLLILGDSAARILARINLDNQDKRVLLVPDNLMWVLREVAIKRFNRIGSEGMLSDSEEGKSIAWEGNELESYLPMLDAVITKRSGRGIARFF